MESQAERLATLWARCVDKPGGRYLFSRIFGWFVPYSATVGATIEDLRPGYCKAVLADRRGLRNHLGSIHAAALVNFGELTSGLAMTMALPPTVRGIVTEIGAIYHKKARGTLVAESRVGVPEVVAGAVDTKVESTIRDESNAVVATVHTVWRLALRDHADPPK